MTATRVVCGVAIVVEVGVGEVFASEKVSNEDRGARAGVARDEAHSMEYALVG